MAKKKEQPVFVSGGVGNTYELKGNLFLGRTEWDHFSTKGEWLDLLNNVFRLGKLDHMFRSYCGRSKADRVVRVNSDGGISIGCNKFSRTSLRKIARWVEWQPYQIRQFLPVIKKA
jgi:hypothetical protein